MDLREIWRRSNIDARAGIAFGGKNRGSSFLHDRGLEKRRR
jgi:hypothetical protein